MLNKRKKCGLLPHIRENIHGLSTNNGQFYGWEIVKFNIPDLWKKSTGKGVKVAVIDTGCDLNHPDLKDSLIDGKNFVEPNSPPQDRNGHGSHVAGTIAASNNSLGMVGVAPNAKIIPVKALGDNGNGDLDNVVNAIIWSVDNGADIVTMSLGSSYSNSSLYRAIKYAESRNVVIFCAAGNSGIGVDIMYPAKYEETISIGAIDINLNRTDFTCSGNSLDFLAPGHDIFSCVPGGYAKMSGTSMSNPFAAGCAALLLSYSRSQNFKNLPSGNRLKTSKDYISVFMKTSQHLNNPSYSRQKKFEGYGILTPKL